jgi:hypothetical protein
MDADAISVVTRALRDTIAGSLGDPLAATDPVVFVGPLDETGADSADVVLFLHRISVNADLRNSEHRVPSSDPAQPANVYGDALPLDLHYLVTVGARQEADELPALAVLGRAMQALNANPILVGGATGREIVRLTLESAGSDEMGRIWTLFPAANYRTSVTYLASPVWIDPRRPTVGGPPVVTETLRFRAGVSEDDGE